MKTIHVTAEDIRLGSPEKMNPCGCVLWRALKRAFPDRTIHVGGEYFWLTSNGIMKERDFPPIVRSKFRSLLMGKSIRPFSFEVEID